MFLPLANIFAVCICRVTYGYYEHISTLKLPETHWVGQLEQVKFLKFALTEMGPETKTWLFVNEYWTIFWNHLFA